MEWDSLWGYKEEVTLPPLLEPVGAHAVVKDDLGSNMITNAKSIRGQIKSQQLSRLGVG